MEIQWIEKCSSTNDEILKYKGRGSGFALASAYQTEGRGRRGRYFASAKGKGLYFSMLLVPSSTEDALLIPPAAAVCVCRTVRALTGLDADIKWPNDILFGGKKICGILTEFRDGFIILGIGLNLNQQTEDFPAEIRETAASLLQCGGKNIQPEQAGRILYAELRKMKNCKAEILKEYLEEYRRLCVTSGKNISIRFSADQPSKEAFCLGVSHDFRLIVRYSDGSTECLDSGEVTVRSEAKSY